MSNEIRGVSDKALSCFCHDAMVDARYIKTTYLDGGKDRNLSGAFMTLASAAAETCATSLDAVLDAVESGWNGPEVTRIYPPDSTIEQLIPDRSGLRTVQYSVQLTFRDRAAHVMKVDAFTAEDRLSPDFKRMGCPPAAVCPK
jgi:hypothetical protein